MIITMDQLTVQDFDYSVGYGGFKNGVVYCSMKTEYWWFVPLRSMGCSDAHASYRQILYSSSAQKRECRRVL